MARIAGVDIPDDKKIKISLTYIFGVGHSRSKEILEEAGVDGETRTKDLSSDQLNKLRSIVSDNYMVEGDLRREVSDNIKRLKDTGTYRGTRHSKNMPSRGQRTKVNSRTVRGNKRSTVGSGRK